MALRILSVDDESDLEILLSQYFRKKIRRGEYVFSFAHNGVEALQMMLKEPFDIVLSDINMPEMDGLTLLARINEMRNPATKCIMVSAYGDMENIRSAMNKGAFDFTTKPINLEDLEHTIEKAAEEIDFIKRAYSEHAQLEQIYSDLHVAQEIQQTILPKDFTPVPGDSSFSLYAAMKAAKYVGGDFYDFFSIDDGRLALVIADVSGKGVPAAILMAICRTMVRAVAAGESSPSACIGRVNRMLCGENLNNMFVTLFYGIYDTVSGTLSYCNAGHNPPLLVRPDGQYEYIDPTGDIALGVSAGASYHHGHAVIPVSGTLLLYTDGVTEECDAGGGLYGTRRLAELCASHAGYAPEELIGSVLDDVEAFASGKPAAGSSDDMTLLALRRKRDGMR